MSGAHAFLAPSSAARWGVCALSARLEAAYPEAEDSPASLEGTAAHWVVQLTLEGRPPALDQQAPNGVAVTREMLEGADLVVETIRSALGDGWRGLLTIEQRVQIPRIHPAECWGTPDYRAWLDLSDGRRILFLWDYKFGHGIVEAFENQQLIAYASGLLSEAAVDGLEEQSTWVMMSVIQPRSFHRDGPVRHWRALASDLRAHVNILHMQAEEALGPNPKARPDPGACKNCRGRHACEALQRAAYQAADKGQQAQAIDLSPLALGRELRELTRAQALLEARVSGLQAQAEATIKRGALVPFWMLESAPGRMKWTKPAAEVLALGQMLGLNLAAPPDVITPTQAKKAGLPESLVEAYAARPPGAAKLVPDDGAKARLTFSSSNT